MLLLILSYVFLALAGLVSLTSRILKIGSRWRIAQTEIPQPGL
ncbi:MAG: hypothetical protein ACI92Z_002700 [Paracoccaceae bacterium]|jgi:hypothetical protein